MSTIREVVQQVFTRGYLTTEAENQLQQLLAAKYDLEDLDAFMALQQAIVGGCVKRESCRVQHSSSSSPSGDSHSLAVVHQ